MLNSSTTFEMSPTIIPLVFLFFRVNGDYHGQVGKERIMFHELQRLTMRATEILSP